MSITPINLWLSITVIINLILAFLIYLKGPKTKANIFYALAVLSATIWTFCMVMFRITEGELLRLWSLFLWATTVPIVLFFLYFSLNFPKERKFKHKFILNFLICFPPLIVLFISILYYGLFKEILIAKGERGFIFNLPNFYFYCAYIAAYFAIAFIILFRKYFQGGKTTRIRLIYVIIGTLIASLAGVIFGLILPLIGNFKFYWLSSGLTIAMTIFIAYAILKHHLFNIKVITTEIFSALIVMILLIDAFLAETRTEFIWKFGLFVGVTIFSILLIRGVLNEVRSREEITKLAQSLEKANIALRKLDKAKSEFISIASHQLRTPLSVIKGFLSMILEGFYGLVSNKAQDKIKKSLESNERLIKLVDHLLDLSHMEEGRMRFEFKKVSLCKIVESAFEELRQQAEEKDLEFIYHRPLKDKLLVKVDPGKIHQVVTNLIDNSIKYTEKGRVEITLKREDGEAVFSVKDTGIGILPEEKKNLFKRFIRGKKVSRMWTEGVGLGLYVAYLIIEAHQGKISGESQGEGKGSEFWVRLPLVK